MQRSCQFRIVAGLGFILMLAGHAGAQDRLNVIAPVSGTTAVLHDAPPDIWVGEEQGPVTGFDRYMIIEGRRVPVFWSQERWLRVVPLKDDNTIDEAGPFWVRWGKVGDSQGAFLPADLCAPRSGPPPSEDESERCRSDEERLAAAVARLAGR